MVTGNKILTGFAFLAVFCLGGFVGKFEGRLEAASINEVPELPDGSYHVWMMESAYDTQTGEPVYWVVAQRMKGFVHMSGNIGLYKVPRSAIENLPYDPTPPGSIGERDAYLSLINGVGRIDDDPL